MSMIQEMRATLTRARGKRKREKEKKTKRQKDKKIKRRKKRIEASRSSDNLHGESASAFAKQKTAASHSQK
jgi:hypothetical protein